MKTRLPIALLSLSAAMSAQTRPNILWLTFEDTSPQFIGCYGNKQAHTPNIDKLASKGVRFDAAFSSSAVSSPSRSMGHPTAPWGVRLNSPQHQMMVFWSRPRSSRSCSSVARPLSSSGSFRRMVWKCCLWVSHPL